MRREHEWRQRWPVESHSHLLQAYATRYDNEFLNQFQVLGLGQNRFFTFRLVQILGADQTLASEFPRDFLGMSLPEQPSKYYFIIRGQRLVLEADSSIQTIMDKLQSYKARVSLNFEVFPRRIRSLLQFLFFRC